MIKWITYNNFTICTFGMKMPCHLWNREIRRKQFCLTGNDRYIINCILQTKNACRLANRSCVPYYNAWSLSSASRIVSFSSCSVLGSSLVKLVKPPLSVRIFATDPIAQSHHRHKTEDFVPMVWPIVNDCDSGATQKRLWRWVGAEWRLTIEVAVKVSEQIISQTGRFNIARISIKIVGGKPSGERESDKRKRNESICIGMYINK